MWIEWTHEHWPFWLFGSAEMAFIVYFLTRAERIQYEIRRGPSTALNILITIHLFLLMVFAALLVLPTVLRVLSILFGYNF